MQNPGAVILILLHYDNLQVLFETKKSGSKKPQPKKKTHPKTQNHPQNPKKQTAPPTQTMS